MKNDLLNDRYFKNDLLTLFMMCLFGADHGRAPKICHTYPTKMKLDTVIPYLKKIQRRTLPSVLLTSGFFHWKSTNFAISRNTDIIYILIHIF